MKSIAIAPMPAVIAATIAAILPPLVPFAFLLVSDATSTHVGAVSFTSFLISSIPSAGFMVS